MRITMAAAAGVAVFFGTACGSGGTDTSGSSAAGATTGNAPASTTGGSGSTTGANGPGTSGTTTGAPLLGDGTACTSNDSCNSGVCGLDGTGNCCSTACKTDTEACAATACNSKGACTYKNEGGACNSTCQYGLFTAYKCGGGACSPSAPVACPNNLACNAAGSACEGSCDPADGNADCAQGWYCAGTTCTPQVQLGECSSNAECQSNVCGVNGTGHCCTQSACTNVNSASNPCGTLDCDGATGECTFPPTTTTCDTGAISCKMNAAGTNLNIQVDPNTMCDGDGTCQAPIETDCSPYACEALGCVTACGSTADCAKDFWCSGGACIPQQAVGACSENDTCLSLQCGGSGSGHCCFQPCGAMDPACGITDCDPVAGSCEYPNNSQACGSILASCASGVEQNPSVCDGAGNCPAPGTTTCAPFVCGATECKTTCTSNTDCATGATCAVAKGICCPALLAGGTLNVDGQSGSDTAACCGTPGFTECQTIGFAMSKIDTAGVKNVTINAYLGGAGNGGDWPFMSVGSYYAYNQPAVGDQVPIKLGWGVELSAPGVNFAPNWSQYGEDCDFDSYNNCGTVLPEIFDIAAYSANDTVGYASIVGTAAIGNVQIGISSANGSGASYNDADVRVEAGQRLYLANAVLANYYYSWEYSVRNYVRDSHAAGVVVSPGGHVTFATDQSGAVTGQVVLGGTSSNNSNQWGSRGLVCETDGTSLGCTVDDIWLDGGVKSEIISNNYYDDIEANDFASITLIGSPQIGNLPSSQGFGNCSNKVDGEIENYDYNSSTEEYEYEYNPMVTLNGQVTMTLDNASISCGDGTGIAMYASPNGNGNPTLVLSGSTIQNTALGIHATAGSVTATNSSIVFNATNIIQDTDGTNNSTFDLSGGGNTVACTSGIEDPTDNPYYCSEGYGDCPAFGTPSAAVNLTTVDLNAKNVAWDTTGPDLFSCTDGTLSSCTCENTSCTVAAGATGMDAVYVSSGVVDTGGASVSKLTCNAPPNCEGQWCTNGNICCAISDPYETYDECYPSSECPGGKIIEPD